MDAKGNVTNVTITLDTPSKNKNRTSGGDEVVDVPSNLGSDQNLLASDALNDDSSNQDPSHFKNNLGSCSPHLHLYEATNSLSNAEAGLGLRNGFSSLQVPFSFGRSSKDADSICTAQSHIMGGEKFDPTVER